MPRESLARRRERAGNVFRQLRATYPNAYCELNFGTPLELLIATILSAQCSDQQVNKVTAELFRRYRTAADFAQAPLPELEDAIRRIGLFRTKAKNIQAACRQLLERHGGEVPPVLESLVELPGVGRKTANVVLGNAFQITSGIVVDTHVARLSQRLGFTTEEHPEKIERDLQTLVPAEDWIQCSHWLIWHGRRRCNARSPDCAACEIATLCPRTASHPGPPASAPAPGLRPAGASRT